MTKVKFCGLTRTCDILWANELQPDYIGFIFVKKSRRFITKEKALELKTQLDATIKTVGVFVDEPLETILSYSEAIDLIQLHGNETNAEIQQIKEATNKPVIKAYSIKSEIDVFLANHSVADFILLDSEQGGTGKVFSWDLAKGITKPYFLAGGLNCDNIATALKELAPYAVDVSSGIETNGRKAKDKMREFIAIVRKDEMI